MHEPVEPVEPPAEPAAGPPSPDSLPSRELTDPRALRAMAHPVRLRILEELAQVGQATATELSERIGESPANCSWHLRQLAQYGFIQEAGGGAGRQRPWKLVVQSTRFRPREAGTELAIAGDAADEVLLGRELEALRAWRTARHAVPAQWRDASFMSLSLYVLTAEELATFRAEYHALVERTVGGGGRLDPASRPPGSRMVRLVAWGIPGGPESETPQE